MKKPLIFLFAFMLLSSGVFSFVPQPTPGVGGLTGVLRMPSADVIPYKNFNVGVDTGPLSFVDKWTLLYKMNLGAFQGMELGCVGTDDQEGGLKEGVFINMKYSLAADTSPYPLLLAIGVENMTSKTLSDVFMVATRYLQNGGRIHFGFVGDFIDIEGIDAKFRPLGALGYDCPVLSENLYGLFECFAGEHVFQLDLGLRWYISETTALNLSGINILMDKNTFTTHPENYRDPKAILVGVSWINPL